jgi:hypothetical protein
VDLVWFLENRVDFLKKGWGSKKKFEEFLRG